MFFICLLTALLTFGESECQVTNQKVFSTCFSQFNHLYFDNPSSTFFTIGDKASLERSFKIDENRGYTFARYATIDKKPRIFHGTAIFIFERERTPTHCNHYFHFLEHLIGIWNFAGGNKPEDVRLFVLASNGKRVDENWKGTNEVTYHLIKALFPYAEIKSWNDFIRDNRGKIVRFENVITSDRAMEKYQTEPYPTQRMLGGYFQQLKREP